jgi:hypothetical protein
MPKTFILSVLINENESNEERMSMGEITAQKLGQVALKLFGYQEFDSAVLRVQSNVFGASGVLLELAHPDKPNKEQ